MSKLSKIIKSQQKEAFLIVCKKQGLTSLEMAKLHKADRHMLARRLVEMQGGYDPLLARTLERPCKKSTLNRKAYTWYLTERGKRIHKRLSKKN